MACRCASDAEHVIARPARLLAPALANAALNSRPFARLMEKTLGFRPSDLYRIMRRSGSIDGSRDARNGGAPRAPEIAAASFCGTTHSCATTNRTLGSPRSKVLEALGFEVALRAESKMLRPAGIQPGQSQRRGSARPAQSRLLRPRRRGYPILFLEPSCYSMFAEDYRELRLPNAEQIGKRCFLFEKFVDDLLEREPHALAFNERERRRDPRALPREIDPQARVHGATGRAFAGKKSNLTRTSSSTS